MATYATMLAEAEAARHELAIGKIASYTVKDRGVTYHSLAALDTYIAELRALAHTESGKRRTMVGRFGYQS